MEGARLGSRDNLLGYKYCILAISKWRGGRVAEGARLESVYRVYSSIEGSNPSPSAIFYSNKKLLRCGGILASVL